VRAMTDAERQAARRARLKAEAAAAPKPKPMIKRRVVPKRRPRPQRWRAAVEELIALQSEYADWLASLPEALRGTATADALEAIASLDLSELEAIEPPRGYGRD
jgi:hypothetical protein